VAKRQMMSKTGKQNNGCSRLARDRQQWSPTFSNEDGKKLASKHIIRSHGRMMMSSTPTRYSCAKFNYNLLRIPSRAHARTVTRLVNFLGVFHFQIFPRNGNFWPIFDGTCGSKSSMKVVK